MPAAGHRDEQTAPPTASPVRLVGINHVALEVGDLEAAVTYYTRIFAVDDVEHEPGMAFLGMGDQFIALSEGRRQAGDDDRHFGLVVDDKDAARRTLEEAGAEVLPGPRLNFRDPWGNLVQVVDYRDIRFTKAAGVLRGMGLEHLDKRPGALDELRRNGLLADEDDPAR